MALVTGSSSGIGLATVVALARDGWQVAASMRAPERAKDLLATLDAVGGAVRERVEIIELDVRDEESVRSGVAATVEWAAGGLHLVVQCAGTAVAGAFEDLSENDWRHVLETNVVGAFRVTRATLPHLRKNGRGHLVFLSSDAGVIGVPGLALYSASKWALEGWVESIAYEVAPFGIVCSIVRPGAYKTAIWDTAPRVLESANGYGAMARRVEQVFEDRLISRARDPREVGELIGRLAASPNRGRLRHAIGLDAIGVVVARRLLPEVVVRRAVGKFFRVAG